MFVKSFGPVEHVPAGDHAPPYLSPSGVMIRSEIAEQARDAIAKVKGG